MQFRPPLGIEAGSHFAYLSPRSLMHSASDTQDRQRPARQIPAHSSLITSLMCAAFPLIHCWPYRTVQVQMAAQRPRSQKPSPHWPSSTHSRSGTFFDQARGKGYISSMTVSSRGGSGGAGGLASLVGSSEETGTGARCGGCSMCTITGASLLDEQAAMQGRLSHAASRKALPRRDRCICFLMATRTPDRCRRGLQDRTHAPPGWCQVPTPTDCSTSAWSPVW